jgi:nucleoid DNA-binding protein
LKEGGSLRAFVSATDAQGASTSRRHQEGEMTKADIVDQIAERTGLTKKDVAETVDNFLNAVARALANGHHIEIRGFGTFRVKDRKSRIARNPRTGEAVPVPPRKVPVFKVSKELKDMVAQG